MWWGYVCHGRMYLYIYPSLDDWSIYIYIYRYIMWSSYVCHGWMYLYIYPSLDDWSIYIDRYLSIYLSCDHAMSVINVSIDRSIRAGHNINEFILACRHFKSTLSIDWCSKCIGSRQEYHGGGFRRCVLYVKLMTSINVWSDAGASWGYAQVCFALCSSWYRPCEVSQLPLDVSIDRYLYFYISILLYLYICHFCTTRFMGYQGGGVACHDITRLACVSTC
jgi:hypothetical protein